MQNVYRALPRIRPTGFGQMLITLEPYGIFTSNFAYVHIFTIF